MDTWYYEYTDCMKNKIEATKFLVKDVFYWNLSITDTFGGKRSILGVPDQFFKVEEGNSVEVSF